MTVRQLHNSDALGAAHCRTEGLSSEFWRLNATAPAWVVSGKVVIVSGESQWQGRAGVSGCITREWLDVRPLLSRAAPVT